MLKQKKKILEVTITVNLQTIAYSWILLDRNDGFVSREYINMKL